MMMKMMVMMMMTVLDLFTRVYPCASLAHGDHSWNVRRYSSFVPDLGGTLMVVGLAFSGGVDGGRDR